MQHVFSKELQLSPRSTLAIALYPTQKEWDKICNCLMKRDGCLCWKENSCTNRRYKGKTYRFRRLIYLLLVDDLNEDCNSCISTLCQNEKHKQFCVDPSHCYLQKSMGVRQWNEAIPVFSTSFNFVQSWTIIIPQELMQQDRKCPEKSTEKVLNSNYEKHEDTKAQEVVSTKAIDTNEHPWSLLDSSFPEDDDYDDAIAGTDEEDDRSDCVTHVSDSTYTGSSKSQFYLDSSDDEYQYEEEEEKEKEKEKDSEEDDDDEESYFEYRSNQKKRKKWKGSWRQEVQTESTFLSTSKVSHSKPFFPFLKRRKLIHTPLLTTVTERG